MGGESYLFGQKPKDRGQAEKECDSAWEDLLKARARARAARKRYETAYCMTQSNGMGGVGYDGAGYSMEYKLALSALEWETTCELRYENVCIELEKWSK